MYLHIFAHCSSHKPAQEIEKRMRLRQTKGHQASKQAIELGSFLQRLADYRNGWLGLVAEMNQAHD